MSETQKSPTGLSESGEDWRVTMTVIGQRVTVTAIGQQLGSVFAQPHGFKFTPSLGKPFLDWVVQFSRCGGTN